MTISARSAESANQAAAQIGGTAAQSNVDAVSDADIVLLAVPFVGAAAEVAREIRDAVAGRTVVAVTNPVMATDGTSAAEEFQKLLPDARIVKAFNTIFASNQADPSREIDAFVAGDDADAKVKAVALADSIGFSPLDVGPLSAARYLEGMAYINVGLNAQNGWSWTSAWKLER